MTRRSNDVISVEQVADIVGIGRQSAYAQCRLYLATGGGEGVPCHRIGRLIRIYRAELEGWLGFPIELPAPESPTRHSRRTRRVPVEQPSLPF